MVHLGVIGTGNMGSAIVRGIKKGGLEVKIFAFDKDAVKLNALPVAACADEKEVVRRGRYVLLAVKPQLLGGVLETIKDEVTADTVFISICAGVSAEFIRSHTLPSAKVILVMPNTPMMLGYGASAIARSENVTEEEFSFACSVFSCCGIAEEIPMDKMKEIICINGSSPAFIYLFAKGFLDHAAESGIAPDAALRLFSASLIGAAKMLTESDMTADQLIRQVSSPGGTTVAGLEKLYEGDFLGDIVSACKACTKRAYELGG
ncbi:MAG: pyrroline-5-carboxylate reductase [Bacteroides sp.]|nr:pyrroline-5-carboxylate reductase [Roseburia sp.]MCM1461194.1 pyrroline-5-carboxylate reductase [Bacteroides sp.]